MKKKTIIVTVFGIITIVVIGAFLEGKAEWFKNTFPQKDLAPPLESFSETIPEEKSLVSLLFDYLSLESIPLPEFLPKDNLLTWVIIFGIVIILLWACIRILWPRTNKNWILILIQVGLAFADYKLQKNLLLSILVLLQLILSVSKDREEREKA